MQGWYAGGAVTSGEGNVVIGESALRFNQTGWGNVAIGWRSLFGASGQSNQYNTAVGYASGNAVTTGTYNTLIGYQAGDNITSGVNNIVIGTGDVVTATASNQLNIGNAIWGTGLTGTGTTDAGLIGIGTNAPAAKLHVLYTTEQLRLGYDASNYLSATVASTGSTTFALTGTTPTFTFSQGVTFSAGITLSTKDIVTDTTTGTKIATSSSQKLALWGKTPVVQPTALTTKLTQITHDEPGTPDYAIQALTQTTPYGFVTADEAQTLLKVIKNLQVRVDELETKLTAVGLLA
jgi:hypothetical protein